MINDFKFKAYYCYVSYFIGTECNTLILKSVRQNVIHKFQLNCYFIVDRTVYFWIQTRKLETKICVLEQEFSG